MTQVFLAPGSFGAGGQFFGLGGLPLNAGTISTYAAGGTTPLATYTSSAGIAQNANPIVLGPDGRPPNEIWLTSAAYRFDLKDSLGNLIKTYDNLGGAFIDAASLAAPTGSGLVGFSQSGTGAVARTVQNKERDIFHVKDFGVVADGITDDTAALVLADAAAAAAKATLRISGILLISSTFTQTCPKIEFAGKAGAIGLSSYLLKKSTMTTDGVQITAPNAVWIGGGVQIQSGATGDGIVLLANGVKVKEAACVGAGSGVASGNGFRIGNDSGSINCNSWQLDGCYSGAWSGHGFYIHSFTGNSPNANAGTSSNCFSQSNGGDGLYEKNAFLNTYIGFLGENNTGYGLRTSGAYTTIVGGDREANTAGQLNLASGAIQISLIGVTIAEVVDVSNATKTSITTRRNERYIAAQGTWTPTIAGSTTPGTQTYSLQTGYWFRDGDYVQVNATITLSALDGTTAGNITIGGLPIALDGSFSNIFSGIYIAQWGGITLTAGYTQLGGRIPSAGLAVTLIQSGSANAAITVPVAALSATSQIIFTARYPIAAF